MNCVLIPTYNEKENIAALINEIFFLLPGCSALVIDDSSPDGTAEEVKKIMAGHSGLSLFLRAKKEGLGKAYIAGFGEILKNPAIKKIIMLDADFSHDPSHLSAMLAESRKYDTIIGSRYVRGGGIKGWEGWRKYLSRLANIYCRLVLRLPIRDYTAGFYVINADMLRQLDFSSFSSSGYAFQIELKYKLHKAGACLKELPIIFHDRRNGCSKITGHIIREGILAPWKIIFKQ
jgi:dolichol-phosphate mannosyltransferase